MGEVSDPCENSARLRELQDQVTIPHALKTWGQFLKNVPHVWSAW